MDKINTTFKKWFEGKAVHISSVVYNTGKKKIKYFDWENVSVLNTKKIKEEQNKIGETVVREIVVTWKKVFEDKIIEYENPSAYCSNEIHDFKSIMQLDEKLKVLIEIYNPSMVFLNHKELKFDDETLYEIRTQVHDVLILKKKKDYSFIHSPNFPFVVEGKIPSQLYAEACYEYYLWLLEYKNKFERASRLVDVFSGNDPKYKLVKDALVELNITAELSDYQISGFVNASIESNVLPRKKAVDLLKLIYKEINKEVPDGLRVRTGTSGYNDIYRKTIEFYPKTSYSGNY